MQHTTDPPVIGSAPGAGSWYSKNGKAGDFPELVFEFIMFLKVLFPQIKQMDLVFNESGI